MGLNQLKWIELPRFADARGILTSLDVVPFDVRNVFFLHSVISERGGHAHRNTRQLLVPVAGSFSVHASDGGDSVVYDSATRPERSTFRQCIGSGCATSHRRPCASC